MELALIDQTDRGRSRLNAALDIYRETILPEAQNPERQILYWIDHSKDVAADQFRCFSIQSGGRVVGYLQYSYFSEERLFFLEYLCLLPSAGAGLAPSAAIDAIKAYIAEHYPPNFSVVFEVARTRVGTRDWTPDRKLISYFKRLGFRVVDFEYRYPVLQTYDGATSYPADLMINLPDARTKVTSSELRTILRCLYFKHYLRWDRPFLEPERFQERERLIDQLYNQQVAQLHDHDHFGTSGDDKRSGLRNPLRIMPKLAPLLSQVFGPKLPRLAIVVALMFILERALGNVWLLIPFVLVTAAIYCLAEDTDASRKLFSAIIVRMSAVRPR